MSEVSEGRSERQCEKRDWRWFDTFFACAGSVVLAGLMTWSWNAFANRGVSSVTGCPPDVGAGPAALLVPVIVAVAVVVVTRRRSHPWYVVVGLATLTLCLASVLAFIAMIFSTPGVCFG